MNGAPAAKFYVNVGVNKYTVVSGLKADTAYEVVLIKNCDAAQGATSTTNTWITLYGFRAPYVTPVTVTVTAVVLVLVLVHVPCSAFTSGVRTSPPPLCCEPQVWEHEAAAPDHARGDAQD
jgi:hypothetical protein